MSEATKAGLLAIDVGSSRVKLGWFAAAAGSCSEPQPGGLPITSPTSPEAEAICELSHRGVEPQAFDRGLAEWLDQQPCEAAASWLASVHPEATARVLQVLAARQYAEPRVLSAAELPISIHVERPELVGIDRLLNALAVNQLRESGRAAIVVDLGTANTVDVVDEEGVFQGGAILPGIAMSAEALHTGTASLPLLPTDCFDVPPAAVGKSTQQAIAAGLYWGTVGAVRQLIERLSATCDRSPQLFVTGGDAAQIAPQLASEERPLRVIPHLVLAGIFLAAEGRS